jgi:hypothetical protein
LLLKVPENVALVADGQGNGPEVVTGTLALKVTDEPGGTGGGLVQGPETVVAAPDVVVQWDEPMVAVATTPPAGIFSLPVGPLAARQNCHGPLVLFELIAAVKWIPRAVPVQVEKVGLLMFAQTSTPGEVEPAGVVPLADDMVQLTVATPTLKDTFVDDAVKAVFCGETVSANAKWAPKPITVASAGAAR